MSKLKDVLKNDYDLIIDDTDISLIGENSADSTGDSKIGIKGYCALNNDDNTSSFSFGVAGFSEALKGSSTGTSAGGIFNAAAGGAVAMDVMLGGLKTIGAFANGYTDVQYIKFETTGGVTITCIKNIKCDTTNGAFIVPRLTTTQRDNLTPEEGMIIYNTTLNRFEGRTYIGWRPLNEDIN